MYSILYSADGQIFQCGPWPSEEQAMSFAKQANGQGENSEFDIEDTNVYLFRPDHTMQELSISDLE